MPITRSVYDGLANTGSPIGWRLRTAQRTSIEQLWKRAASPADDGAARMGLPPRCDATWFKKTFCGGDAGVDGRGPCDPIWDLVKTFNMYDTLALIAAVPLLRDVIFDPISVPIAASRVPGALLGSPRGLSRQEAEKTDHLLIGTSPKHHGFAGPEAKDECASLMGSKRVRSWPTSKAPSSVVFDSFRLIFSTSDHLSERSRT